MRGYLGAESPIAHMVSLRFSDAELDTRRAQITSFMSDQVEAADTDGVVLGLSGGIDSSLTAVLAVEALGAESVFGLSLPAAVSAEQHQSDADRLAEQLGIHYDVIDIEPIVHTIDEAFPDGSMGTFARGNARARVRAVLNYALANDENRLVIGTGNRTEALVGYFTKFGDGAVDCHPIGNLYKCQVRQLARAVGVPDDIIEKSPTAELWEDQTDEEELGIAYDTLDRILALHVDGPFSASATADAANCSVATVERVVQIVTTSEHKRRVPPTP